MQRADSLSGVKLGYESEGNASEGQKVFFRSGQRDS